MSPVDCTDVLVTGDGNRRAQLALRLLESDAFGSTADRVQAFVE
jgi:hypothetical protein